MSLRNRLITQLHYILETEEGEEYRMVKAELLERIVNYLAVQEDRRREDVQLTGWIAFSLGVGLAILVSILTKLG